MAANILSTINEDHLTCQICLLLFTKPKALPCLHTFCESCLQLYVDGHEKKNILSCPTCRNETKIPENGVKGFPDNHLLTSLQHTLSSRTDLEQKQRVRPGLVGRSLLDTKTNNERALDEKLVTEQEARLRVRAALRSSAGHDRRFLDERRSRQQLDTLGDSSDHDFRGLRDVRVKAYTDHRQTGNWRDRRDQEDKRTLKDHLNWRDREDQPAVERDWSALRRGPPRDHDPQGLSANVIVKELPVGKEYVGRIIGTKGVRINEIKKTSGASLRFRNSRDESGKSTLTIQGSQASVDEAMKIVEGILEEMYLIHTDTMDVPDYAMGRVIESSAAICNYFIRGICSKGNACPFRHVKGDRTIVCKHWLRGLCKKGDECEFLHEYDMSKMPECFFFSKYVKEFTTISREMIIEMEVPDKAVGFVIGKGGSRIKQVSEKTGARLHFKVLNTKRPEMEDTDISDESKTSTLVIRGTHTTAEQAYEMVRKLLLQLTITCNNPDIKITTTKQSVIEINIPQKLIRNVVGQQWSRIQQVEATSHARIQLRSVRHPSTGDLTHRLTIRGTPESTLQAEKLLQDLKDSVHIEEISISIQNLHQILGGSNSNIRDVCRLSHKNAKISVSRAGDETDPSTMKHITISGKEDDTKNLKDLLETLVNEAEQDIKTGSRTALVNAAEPNLPQDVDLFECGCCFDDEVPFEDMGTCGDGHLFCRSCIQRSCEAAIGQGKAQFPCLAADCDMTFSTQELQAILPQGLGETVLRAMQAEDLRQANIPDLVHCPHCSFGIIMPDKTDTVLKCLNPECRKESCRLCKEPKHTPLRCDQVEKQGETTMRAYIENKMTEAMLRTCYKCGKAFYKTEGCNKMTCPCGAKMCYVCRQPIVDYTHFDRAGGCPLTSDVVRLHTTEMTKAGQAAKEKFKQDHPDTENVTLKHDPVSLIRFE